MFWLSPIRVTRSVYPDGLLDKLLPGTPELTHGIVQAISGDFIEHQFSLFQGFPLCLPAAFFGGSIGKLGIDKPVIDPLNGPVGPDAGAQGAPLVPDRFILLHIEPLAGITFGVHIGDVVGRDVQSLLLSESARS